MDLSRANKAHLCLLVNNRSLPYAPKRQRFFCSTPRTRCKVAYVELTPGCPVTPETVQQICEIDDDAYRNRWIVYAYHDISGQLRKLLGENANFATFATWSSRIIGEQIRAYARPYQIERRRDEAGRMCKPFLNLALEVQQKWRERTEGSVGQVMGYGNRMIFQEIALELSRFAQEYLPGGEGRPWEKYQKTIVATPATDLFPAADLQRFRDGMHAYYLAACLTRDNGEELDEPTEQKRAELVLRGTLLISSYEQWRVDVVLKAAMSLFPRRLLRVADESLLVLGENPWRTVEMKRRQQPWIMRHRSPWRRWLANRYARSLTRRVMNLEIPKVLDLDEPPLIGHVGRRREDLFESLRLGRPVNVRTDGTLYYPPLATLRDSTTAGIFDVFDRSKSQPKRKLSKRYRARDWSHYDDRMSYIAIYFRARQGQSELFANLPYEYRVVSAMNVSDTRLHELRGVGDPFADELCVEIAKASGDSGRGLLPALLKAELGRDAMTDHISPDLARRFWDDPSNDPSSTLPDWADDKRLGDGQKFFQRFRVEIASALFGAALPKTYTAWRGARVLTETADRMQRQRFAHVDDVNLITGVERRVAETGQMLLDIMGTDGETDAPSDGPFRPNTRACEAARGVRLFHASVRHQLLYGGDGWDEATLGKPVNQEDLLGTLAAFTVEVLEALHRMGAQVTKTDRDGYVHLWLVVGHFLGIDYELLFPGKGSGAKTGVPPLDYEELRVLTYRIYRRNSGFSVDGCRLEDALLEMQRSTMRVLKPLPVASVRAFLGDDIADDLGVVHSRSMRHLIKVMFAFNVVRTYGYHVDWFAWLVRRRTHKLYVHFIKRARGDRPGWRMSSMESLPHRTVRRLIPSRSPAPPGTGESPGSHSM